MRIICITDQFEGSNHSSIEGIFGTYLSEYCQITLVYFTEKSDNSRQEGNRIYLPRTCKRRGIVSELQKIVPLNTIDCIIVRNYFPVLQQMLAVKQVYRFRLGFWNSFPHTYRRLFEAQQSGRGLLRKRIEYSLKNYYEQRLVRRCDFLIVMSPEFKDFFYSTLNLPWFALPMGVVTEGLPNVNFNVHNVPKLVYTGTVDQLRQTDLIIHALIELDNNFQLDIYTSSNNRMTDLIRRIGDKRVQIRPPQSRTNLLETLTDYDIGIGLIPDNNLYRVSSPTKTIEYYSIGLPALINYLPEYTSLFDHTVAFFCNFSPDSIKDASVKALAISKHQLVEMGINGKKIIIERRNYRNLACTLHSFVLEQISG